jgi:hypothetical protein
MTPRLPQPEEREEPPTPQAENAATCLAMALLLLLVMGLGSLMWIVLPLEFGVLFLLVATGGGFFAFHYFVWGRWLSRFLRDRDEPEDEANP